MNFDWRLAGRFLEWLCEIGITYLAALRSYTLFGLSGCVVEFSFFTYFFCKNSIYQQDYYYRSAFILLDKQFLSPTISKTASVLLCGRSAWCGVCSSINASVR